jgi:hypothetical protein
MHEVLGRALHVHEPVMGQLDQAGGSALACKSHFEAITPVRLRVRSGPVDEQDRALLRAVQRRTAEGRLQLLPGLLERRPGSCGGHESAEDQSRHACNRCESLGHRRRVDRAGGPRATRIRA